MISINSNTNKGKHKVAQYTMNLPTCEAFKIVAIKDYVFTLDNGDIVKNVPGMITAGFVPSIGDYIIISSDGSKICMTSQNFQDSYSLASVTVKPTVN